MRTSGLGKVSRDKRQRSTTSITPLRPIATSTIDAILIKRRQSARDTSPLNAKRKAEAISFEATSSLTNKRNKNVVRASGVSRQNWFCDIDYRRRCVNHRKTSATNTAMKPGDPLNGKHQTDQAYSCPWSHTTWASGSTKNKSANNNKKNYVKKLRYQRPPPWRSPS